MNKPSHELPTIEEWLALEDCDFSPNVIEGTHGDYFWVSCEGASFGDELSRFMFLPTEFRVLVTYWDCPGGVTAAYRNEPGWKIVDSYALGPPLKYIPEMNFHAPNSAMLIEGSISECDIGALFEGFEEFQPYMAESDCFWNVVDRVNPFSYFSDLDEGLFVARGKELYDLGFNNEVVAAVTTKFRVGQQRIRQSSWNSLGPECGPEKCVESNCDRLRIQLAVRCFLHQTMGRWKTQEY